MLIDKETHIIFQDRKNAKELFGIAIYNLFVKNKRLIFIDKDNPLQTVDEQINWVCNNYPINRNYDIY